MRLLNIGFVLLLSAVAAFAAPKSASAYYSDAAFQYIENRLPSAEITCNEGLQYYPNDQKLQMLLDRIQEAKDEQKNENKKNDKNQDNQDQNKDQNQDQNQDQNNDQNQNQDQNKDQNGENGESSSSGEQDQNQDQNGQGESSSSEAQSSDGQGGAAEQPEPEQPQDEQDSSGQGEEPQEQPVQMGEMTPEEASQLLKDFDEQNGERKPWKPIRGQARPAKDW